MKAFLTFLGLYVFLITVPLSGQDGSLDTTFGTNGIIRTDIGSGGDYGRAIAIHSDGKIFVAGYSYTGSNYDLSVVSYNSNGSLNTSFSGDGKVTTAIGSDDDKAYAIAVQSDGKIIVAGETDNGSKDDIAVVRYNTDGILDTSFDSDGIVTLNSGSNDCGYALAIQSDGKILVTGIYQGKVLVARFNSNDGSLDTTFSADGIVTTSISGVWDYGRAIALQSDGKIVVAGYSYNGSNDDFLVVRYNVDGSLDTSFDSDGCVTTAIGTSNDAGFGVGIDASGKIVVAGRTDDGLKNYVAVVRYNSNGSLDTSFDGDGKTTTSIDDTDWSIGYGVMLDFNSKILVAGTSTATSFLTNFGAVRYNYNGSLDTSFSGDGKMVTSLSSNQNGYCVAIQSDGKIVIAGSDGVSGTQEYIVARYTGSAGPLPVELSFFTAQYLNDTPTLCWTTQSETSNAGWNVYRSESDIFEEASQINTELIPGAGSTSEPTDYVYVDENEVVSNTEYWYWLESVDYSGDTESYGPITLLIPEDEEEPGSPEIPGIYGLHQNYPNPFNPSTEISFMMKESCVAELAIYNIKGEKIATLFQNKSVAKDELIRTNWDGKDDFGKSVSSGIYLYKLRTNKADFVRKMILMK